MLRSIWRFFRRNTPETKIRPSPPSLLVSPAPKVYVHHDDRRMWVTTRVYFTDTIDRQVSDSLREMKTAILDSALALHVRIYPHYMAVDWETPQDDEFLDDMSLVQRAKTQVILQKLSNHLKTTPGLQDTPFILQREVEELSRLDDIEGLDHNGIWQRGVNQIFLLHP